MPKNKGRTRYEFDLNAKRDIARERSLNSRDPECSEFVYRMIGLESGRDHGYILDSSLEPETISEFLGEKCRLVVVARFFHGQEMP
jgi:hypothetical protein